MKKILNQNILREIYYNQFETSDAKIKDKEYKKISKEIRKIEKKILNSTNKAEKVHFERYFECITRRESLEAENQFKIGFKTAMKIVFEVFED